MKQINVITPNRTGVLHEILEVLAAQDINVECVDVESVEQQGIVSLIVDRYDEAFKLLTHAGFQAVSEEVLVVVVADRPGALGRISHLLKEANIGIRSVRILQRQEGQSTVGVVTEDNDAARIALGEMVIGAE